MDAIAAQLSGMADGLYRIAGLLQSEKMPKPTRIIPMVEVNDPDRQYRDGMTQLETCWAGLEHWGRFCDTVIVTTFLDQVSDLYGRIGKGTKLSIIGGFKTTGFSVAFHDDRLWEEVATHAADVASLTGNRTVALDNETALEPFMRDKEELDLRRLWAALYDVPQDIDWILAEPHIHKTSAIPNQVQRTTELVSCMARAFPRAKFISPYSGYADRPPSSPVYNDLREGLRIASGGRMVERLWVHPTPEDGPHPFWVPDQVAATSAELGGESIIIYPGLSNFIEVGRMMAELHKGQTT